MADRLYLGPVSKQLRGNREDARTLEREARIKVGYLFDSMRPGETFKTGSWSLSDGRRIMAFVWNDVLGKRATVRLVGVNPEPIEISYCISTSGLYSVSNFSFGDIFLPDPAPEGSTQYYAFLEQIGKNTWNPAAFDDSPEFSAHFITTGSPYRYPDSLVIKKSGLFTGEMKRVVQLLAGQNAEIPYRFEWSITHGIFINQQTGDRWVVQIDNNGIRTWLLEVVDFTCTTAEKALVDYLPVPVTDLDTVTGKITLCDSTYLSELYDNGGPLLGPYQSWAFSASGHEAQVVISYPGFGAGGEYSKSFRYKLVFSADESGAPAGVALTLEQEGYVYTRDVGKNVRAPILTTCGPSHPIALFSTGLLEPPEEGVISFPINVYYIGEEEQVFTFNHKVLGVEDEIPDTEHPTLDDGACSSFLYDPAWISMDLYTGGRGATKGGSTITGIPWAETDIDNTVITNQYWHTRFDLSDAGGPGCCVSGSSSPWGIYGSNHKLTKTTIYYPATSKLYQFCLIFPWWEREAYLFQERRLTTQSEAVTKYTSTKRVFGTSWHNSGSNAGLTNWNMLSTDAWCLTAPLFYKYLGACSESDPTPSVSITDYVPWQSTDFYNVGGPLTTCCSGTDQKFVVYSVGSAVARDDVCNAEEELASDYATDTRVFKGQVNAANVARTIELSDATHPLFSSGLYDDLGACSLLNTDPFWFGAWLDAFTGRGWIKHEGYAATDNQYVGSANGVYPMLDSLPVSVEFSGWFGTPFPEQMTG